jgi:hypothetical protein
MQYYKDIENFVKGKKVFAELMFLLFLKNFLKILSRSFRNL